MCVKVITVFSGGSGEGPVKETGDYFPTKKVMKNSEVTLCNFLRVIIV